MNSLLVVTLNNQEIRKQSISVLMITFYISYYQFLIATTKPEKGKKQSYKTNVIINVKKIVLNCMMVLFQFYVDVFFN